MNRFGSSQENQFKSNIFVFSRIQSDFSPFVATIKTDIVQKVKELGVPEKPKKPGNAYVLFVTDMQVKVKKDNPHLNSPEIFKKCAEIWKSLDSNQKDKYLQLHKVLAEKYDNDILKYQANLSEDQKTALTLLAEAKKKDKQNRKKRKVIFSNSFKF